MVHQTGYKNKWGIIIVSILSSVSMTAIYSLYVVEELQSMDFLKILLIIVGLHLPILISYFLKWRYFHVVSIIGWLIIWIGYIYYLIDDNEGMKDLVIITWITFSWILTHSIALLIQVFISIKQKRKGPL
ncbi:hypothetical protein IM538_19880 [Cytobacillus suaedae]|nr:hypothetical protein IM538_19880 [Cytobacillus suaedae]